MAMYIEAMQHYNCLLPRYPVKDTLTLLDSYPKMTTTRLDLSFCLSLFVQCFLCSSSQFCKVLSTLYLEIAPHNHVQLQSHPLLMRTSQRPALQPRLRTFLAAAYTYQRLST